MARYANLATRSDGQRARGTPSQIQTEYQQRQAWVRPRLSSLSQTGWKLKQDFQSAIAVKDDTAIKEGITMKTNGRIFKRIHFSIILFADFRRILYANLSDYPDRSPLRSFWTAFVPSSAFQLYSSVKVVPRLHLPLLPFPFVGRHSLHSSAVIR